MHQLLRAKKCGMLADSSLGNVGDWQGRHNAAVSAPKDEEYPIVAMLTGWLEYAAEHQSRCESSVGQDGYLGEPWADIGRALLMLLNGNTSRLDCGTLDKLIRGTLEANGITED